MAKRTKNVKDILKAVNLKVEEVVEEIRKEIDNFRPILEKDINKVIARNKDLFNIEKQGGPELVRELGVGDVGEFNRFKIDNAWTGLKIGFDSGKRAAPVSLLFSKEKKKLGRVSINYSINESFYDLNLTTFENTGKAKGRIPWMQWFIEGIVIQGYEVKTIDDAPKTPIIEKASRFTEQIKRFSRTGEALMVKSKSGAFWTLKPRPQTWPHMQNEIGIQIEKSTIKFLKQIEKKFKK